MKNEKNMGISATRNKLLKMARGEYLAIFDHDDISVPTRLQQEVEYLDANPDVGVVSGWLQCFGVEHNIFNNPESDVDIKTHLMHNCFVAHTASMIRKSVLDENNIEYEAFYSPAEDYRLWARLMDVTRFHNIQQVLVLYRTHDNMTTIRQQKQMNDAWRAISLDLGNKYPAYYREMLESMKHGTQFRLRLFGIIPLLKIKNNWVQLFECIPLFKLKWK